MNTPTASMNIPPAGALATDGGPAFPVQDYEVREGVWASETGQLEEGMTLRDWFAGKAMQLIYAGEGARMVAARDQRYDETNWSEIVASNAYGMADAMLRARK